MGRMAATTLERLLRMDRLLLGCALFVVLALCWAWLIPLARDMYGPMTGLSAWMMTQTWDLAHCALLLAMWTVMMVGMMLPSVTPVLFLYAAVIRKSDAAPRATAHVYAFAGGYLLAWATFSVLATVLQLLLSHWLWLTPMMEPRTRTFSGVLLLLAGLYQLTPLKRACLQSCQAPAEFLTRNWRPGLGGAARVGWRYGRFCIGCCWALMLLLFVGGVMNLWCIGLLTLLVLLEKLLPARARAVPLAGLVLLTLGICSLLAA